MRNSFEIQTLQIKRVLIRRLSDKVLVPLFSLKFRVEKWFDLGFFFVFLSKELYYMNLPVLLKFYTFMIKS